MPKCMKCKDELKQLNELKWVCMKCSKFYTIPVEYLPDDVNVVESGDVIIQGGKVIDMSDPEPVRTTLESEPYENQMILFINNFTNKRGWATRKVIDNNPDFKIIDVNDPVEFNNLKPKLAEGGIITKSGVGIIDTGDIVPLDKVEKLSAAGVITVSDSNGPLTDKQKKEIDKIWEVPKKEEFTDEEKYVMKYKQTYGIYPPKEESPVFDEKIIDKAIDVFHVTQEEFEKAPIMGIGVDFDKNGKPVIYPKPIPSKFKFCPRCGSETFSSTKSNYGYYDSTCHNCQFGWRESIEVFEQHGDIHPVGGI